MWFLKKNWIYYDLLKINNKKNLEMKISVKIVKLLNWYPNLEIHIWIEILQSKDSVETKIIKFHLVY